MKGRNRLGRRQRISRSGTFDEAFAQAKPHVGRFLVLRVRSGDGASLRLGVIASKRTFRRAVDRARAKRLLREAFRVGRCRMRGAYDVVLVARRRILSAKLRDVERDLEKTARHARLMAEE